MSPRQTALLDYHRDVAASAATKPATVFEILDLEDREGYAIAKELNPQSAEKRTAIAEPGCYPSFTLTVSREHANRLLAHGWPNAKPIPAVDDEGVIPIMLVLDGRCVCLLMRRR